MDKPQKDSTVKTGEFKWYIIDDFESCYQWPIVNKLYMEKAWSEKNPILCRLNGASKNLTAEKKEKCLAAKIKIDYMGDTREFITPLRNINLDGICQKISFWVHSMNKSLTIKVMLKDSMNTIYFLEPDTFTLDFYGWKKLEINDLDKKIIDQLPTTAPNYKPLQFMAIVIENPQHIVYLEPVYIYIDQLEAFLRQDKFSDYDGSDMPKRW